MNYAVLLACNVACRKSFWSNPKRLQRKVNNKQQLQMPRVALMTLQQIEPDTIIITLTSRQGIGGFLISPEYVIRRGASKLHSTDKYKNGLIKRNSECHSIPTIIIACHSNFFHCVPCLINRSYLPLQNEELLRALDPAARNLDSSVSQLLVFVYVALKKRCG